MKKNKMMRLASGLLVTTLLSASIISGTYAKYTSTDTANDTARVAKWGVVIETSGSLFGQKYGSAGNTTDSNTPSTGTDNISVQYSGTATDVVAPGTKNTGGLSYSISGSPEVTTKVDVTIIAKDIYLDAGTYGELQKVAVSADDFATKKANLYKYSDSKYVSASSDASYSGSETYYQITNRVTISGSAYYPIGYMLDSDSATTAKSLADTIVKKLGTSSATSTDDTSGFKATTYSNAATYTPNTNLATTTNALGSGKITWEWKYDDKSVADKDIKDTILGDLMNYSNGPTVVDISGTTITPLTVSNNLVKKGNTTVGCLETKLDITIKATQQD